MKKEAEELNNVLKEDAPHIYNLLSDFGKDAFFPKRGVLSQTAEAKKTRINASIGQAREDDRTPMVPDILLENVRLPPEQVFMYSSTYGKKELRRVWQQEILKKNPSIKGTISMPVVTTGLTHGLSMINRLFINRGESIVLPDLFWENYELIYYSANLDKFPYYKGEGFNVKGLEQKLSEGSTKKSVLLNFPGNPTGYSPTDDEAKKIIEVIKNSAEDDNEIIVVCDDAYFGFLYEDVYKESLFAELSNLDERVLAVKIDGISKEMFSWGLRIGFITYGFKGVTGEIASVLEDKTAGDIRRTTSNACTQSQNLILNALKSPRFSQQSMKKYEILKERYETVKKIFSENPDYAKFFETIPFNSGYFMCLRLKDNNANDIRKKLIEKFDTGVISRNGMLRVAYSSVGVEELPKLFENIYKACRE